MRRGCTQERQWEEVETKTWHIKINLQHKTGNHKTKHPNNDSRVMWWHLRQLYSPKKVHEMGLTSPQRLNGDFFWDSFLIDNWGKHSKSCECMQSKEINQKNSADYNVAIRLAKMLTLSSIFLMFAYSNKILINSEYICIHTVRKVYSMTKTDNIVSI